MSNSKPLLPTITLALGALVGGWVGATASSFAASETLVVACYITGFLGGACLGGTLGSSWHRRSVAGQVNGGSPDASSAP